MRLQDLQPLSVLRRLLELARFQTTTGIGRYLDMTDLGTENFERDSFYFNQAEKIIARERGHGPLFLYVYTVAIIFPGTAGCGPS